MYLHGIDFGPIGLRVYIHMYIYIYVYIHIYIYIYIHPYIHTRSRVCRCMEPKSNKGQARELQSP